MRNQLLKFGYLLIQLVCSNSLVYLECFILVADKLVVPRRMPLKPDEGGITDDGCLRRLHLAPQRLLRSRLASFGAYGGPGLLHLALGGHLVYRPYKRKADASFTAGRCLLAPAGARRCPDRARVGPPWVASQGGGLVLDFKSSLEGTKANQAPVTPPQRGSEKLIGHPRKPPSAQLFLLVRSEEFSPRTRRR
jgi:hypothetical protein